MKMIVKQYGENIALKNKIIVECLDEDAMKLFLKEVEDNIGKRMYEIDGLNDIDDDKEFNEKFEQEYSRKVQAVIDFAKQNNYCEFGDYRIALMDEEEDAYRKVPSCVGCDTFNRV